jgi:tetratricopeptide (TPR) repeat protein
MVGMYRAMQASGMAEWADECAKAATRMEGEKRFGKAAEAFADLAANSGDAAGKISALNSRARILRTGDLPGCQQASSEAVACWLSDKACAPPDAECFQEAADLQASKGDYSAAWGGIKAHPTHLACYDVLLSATWTDSAPEGLKDIGGSGSSREGSSSVEKLAARAAMSHPGSARAWIRIGAAMNGRGRHARARPLLEAWAKKAPQDAGSWLALGDAYVNTGAPKSALKCAAKSAECATSCPRGGVGGLLRASTLLSAECLVRQRNFDEARQEFSKVLADDPSSLKALDGMGRACAGMGDRASARDYFGQVLSADPLNHGVFSRLADLCGEEGRWAKAADYMKQAADIAPSNAAYRYGLGRSRWMQGGQVRSGRGAASAFPELLAAVKLDPNMARAWTLLGHYYKVEAKDSERAKKVYAKALSLDPADAEAGEALCAMHISAGQAGLVMAACEDAISASTTAAWAHLRKGTLLLGAGRADDAAAPLQVNDANQMSQYFA